MTTLGALEARTRNFYDWELQGRGWRAYSHPVALEPPFRPFQGHYLPTVATDDGRKPTFLSRMVERFRARGQPIEASNRTEDDDDVLHAALVHARPVSEWEILVPADLKLDPAISEAWLRTVTAATGPLAFELVGVDQVVSIRLGIQDGDVATVLGQLRAFLPTVSVRRAERSLESLWSSGVGDTIAAIEFGLGREFVVPLRVATDGPDPLTPFIGALAQVAADEVAVVQVLFERTRAPWAAHAIAAVTAPDGEPFFIDAPEMTELAREKCSAPLYAVAVRIALQCDDEDRAWTVLRSLAGALSQYGSPDRNEFVPLAVDDTDALISDVLARSVRRDGMILSLPELSSLVRLPGERLRTPALLRTSEPEEMLPTEVLGTSGAVIGEAKHKGSWVPVRISPEARMQHVYVIGASGTGKSSLLGRMIVDDIAAGAGVGVLDPHGDLVDEILGRIPPERVKDVVLFDPADADNPVGWNILGAHSDIEKELLASDLVGVFQRLSTSWGDQMSVVLGNAVMAFLDSPTNGTLVELRRFLLDDEFRKRFLATVTDPHIVSFWHDEWPLLVGKRPQAPILTRLDILLRSRLVRQAVTKQENGINFRSLIDSGGIFLGKLSQGAIGEENAALLGSLLVSKFHQVSLSRQDVAVEARRPFYLFIDEFQQVVTPSMAGLFSGLRKYRLGVTVAHHDLYQLHANAPDVERAVLTNAYTRVFFRTSDEDARKLEKGLGGFTADDLTSLSRGEAICRVEQREQAFRLRTKPLDAVTGVQSEQRRTDIRAANAVRYATVGESAPRTTKLPAAPSVQQAPAAVAPPPPREQSSVPAVVLPAPGRGGPIHKYLQSLLRQWGQAAGFRVEVEHTIAGDRRVDVALFHDDLSIACEIAGVTMIEQETGNISKCLEAGFSRVVAVSLDAGLLRKLKKALAATLTGEMLARVSLCSPEELLALLTSMVNPEVNETRVAGYKVRVRHTAADSPDADDRRRAIAEVMMKSIRRMRTDG